MTYSPFNPLATFSIVSWTYRYNDKKTQRIISNPKKLKEDLPKSNNLVGVGVTGHRLGPSQPKVGQLQFAGL